MLPVVRSSASGLSHVCSPSMSKLQSRISDFGAPLSSLPVGAHSRPAQNVLKQRTLLRLRRQRVPFTRHNGASDEADPDQDDDLEADAGVQFGIQQQTGRSDAYRIVEAIGQQLKNDELAFWLRTNFKERVGHIIRHDYVYQRYLLHAAKCGMIHEDILHQNTVRCIVRATFLGLSNRCFGRKGGSKHDYFGLQKIMIGSIDHLKTASDSRLCTVAEELQTDPLSLRALVTVYPTAVKHELFSHLTIGSKSWTAEHVKRFGRAVHKFGKNFPFVAAEIPGSTAKDCIEFYYAWKKRFPEDYHLLKTSRRWREAKANTYRVMRRLKM